MHWLNSTSTPRCLSPFSTRLLGNLVTFYGSLEMKLLRHITHLSFQGNMWLISVKSKLKMHSRVSVDNPPDQSQRDSTWRPINSVPLGIMYGRLCSLALLIPTPLRSYVALFLFPPFFSISPPGWTCTLQHKSIIHSNEQEQYFEADSKTWSQKKAFSTLWDRQWSQSNWLEW